MTLMNLISAHHMDLSPNPKVLDVCGVGSLNWYSKDLDSINMELKLINQSRGLVKYPVATGAAVVSVSNRRHQTRHCVQKPTKPLVLPVPSAMIGAYKDYFGRKKVFRLPK